MSTASRGQQTKDMVRARLVELHHELRGVGYDPLGFLTPVAEVEAFIIRKKIEWYEEWLCEFIKNEEYVLGRAEGYVSGRRRRKAVRFVRLISFVFVCGFLFGGGLALPLLDKFWMPYDRLLGTHFLAFSVYGWVLAVVLWVPCLVSMYKWFRLGFRRGWLRLKKGKAAK